MKILFDIIHPGNVHYFKNIIRALKANGHEIIITAKNKDVIFELLIENNLGSYIDFGKAKKGQLGALIYLLRAEFKMLKVFFRYRPDITVGFGSSYLSHISFLFRKPFISFDDSEHAKLNRLLYSPFASVIFSPKSYFLNLGKKHFKFNAFMELFYLHASYFKPDIAVLDKMGLKKGEEFIVFRFINWDAFHDIGQNGLSIKHKILLINLLDKRFRIFISSESEIPPEFKQYELTISKNDFHSVLYYSTMYIGEGATTASECAMMGTPAVYINSLSAGTLDEQEKAGLIFTFRNSNDIVKEIFDLTEISLLKGDVKIRRDEFLKNSINPTLLFIWFIENYPESKDILFADPDYQHNFN